MTTLKAAWVTGLLILILAATAVVLVAIRRQVAEQSFWLAVIAYVLATLVAITVGRSRFGIEYALSSRYATSAIPLVIATYVLLIPGAPRGSDLPAQFLLAQP